MPEISIILPSLRSEEVLQRIDEFSKTNPDSDYEIIVVSPFTVKGEKVVHIKEEPLGCIHAHNTAYQHSSGNYIVYWGDRASPTTNCLSDMLNFVKSNTDPFIGSFRLRDSRGGRERTQQAIYGKLFAPFGCVSRNTIDIVGGYFDPLFKAYWVDPDICLRTWEHGGKVDICPNAWLEVDTHSDEIACNNWGKFFDNDQKTFFNRWGNKFGKGINRDFDTVFLPFGMARIIGFFPSFIRPSLFNLYGSWKKLKKPKKIFNICWFYYPNFLKPFTKKAYQKLKGMLKR